MQTKLAWGIFAAALLGSATGVAAAPRQARVALKRRTVSNIGSLISRYQRWLSESRVDAALATDNLKAALGEHPSLGKRRIWVDAHGSTILLHGVVENDAEWRFADKLARAASPDGSVRNLLQVQPNVPGL